jgi:hypothetical protein
VSIAITNLLGGTYNMDEIITLAEAAELLGRSPSTLRNQVKAGRLDGRLIGKTYVTTRAAVERYRREHLGRLGRPPGRTTKFSVLKAERQARKREG